MAVDTGKPSQYKQKSRKGKKSWRKNIDLEDVEEKLEETREEEIHLGTHEPMFTEDRVGDEEHLSKAMRSERKLKSLEILYARSEVPPVIAAHKKKDRPRSKVTKDHKKLLERAGFTGKNKLQAEIERDGLLRAQRVSDLWDEPANDKLIPKVYANNQPYPTRIQRAPQAPIPGTPAVNLPQSGQSYNPALEDWKATIMAEHNKLVEDEEREQQAAEQKLRIESIILETQAKLDNDDESEEEDSDPEVNTDGSYKLSANPPASQVRKTQTQKNKEKRHKQYLRELEELKLKKKFIKELQAKSKTAANENIKADAKVSKNNGATTSHATKEKMRLKAHSNHPVIPEPLAVKLSDELNDSLRKLKPEGSLLHERVRSFQARGIVEARVPVKKPRNRSKMVEKWSFKHFT